MTATNMCPNFGGFRCRSPVNILHNIYDFSYVCVRCVWRLRNLPLNFNQSRPLDHETSLDLFWLFVSLEVGGWQVYVIALTWLFCNLLLVFLIEDKTGANIAKKLGMIMTMKEQEHNTQYFVLFIIFVPHNFGGKHVTCFISCITHCVNFIY